MIMVGAGGVLLELIKDTSFSALPVTQAKARFLLAQTRVSKLMAGYRGGRPADMEAAVRALLALGRIAKDLGDVIESIDINPFVVLEHGGRALDALVVLRMPDDSDSTTPDPHNKGTHR